jgi:single-stranded DNA-binding protein
MGDINKVTLVGMAITKPSFVDLASKTPTVIFTLKVKETWKSPSGEKREKSNLVDIEVMGKNAFKAKDMVKVGKRYHVDGYLRSDPINGKEELRVRTFHIEEEDGEDYSQYVREGVIDGMSKAYALMDNSDDLGSAKMKLKVLLEQG